MNDSLLRLYHRLPAPTRSVAATMRGYHLRSWYYGPETDRLTAEALERDQWSREQWQNWREEQLPRVLHRSATKVAYYRDQWAARRRRGDRASWEYLENWPVLEKDPLRENPKQFVADDCDIRRMFALSTSGTSGKPLSLWCDRSGLRRWYALLEARARNWGGVSRQDRWGRLAGQLVVPVSQVKPPFWVWNRALNQLYMSSHHLAPQLVPYYLDALARYRIKYLLGYSSSLNALAQEALRQKRDDLKMAVVITIAEPVLDYQRTAITAAFNCPVRQTYGMVEAVAAASECQAGSLHSWPEVGVVEVINENKPVKPNTVGDLVCTSLMNTDMPLIRYRVGDRGSLASEDATCECGRGLPMMNAIQGRNNDLLITKDGRQIFWLNPIFYGLPVREAQIIQEKIDEVRVCYVPTQDFTAEGARSITTRLRERVGNVNVILEQVDEVPRGANGKFRAVICKVPLEDRPVMAC
jgi:phenylacetate-CoA ligase